MPEFKVLLNKREIVEMDNMIFAITHLPQVASKGSAHYGFTNI